MRVGILLGISLTFSAGQAQTFIWDGGGGAAPNNTWSADNTNWDGDVAPTGGAGQDLVFTGSANAVSGNVSTVNDIASNTRFGSITFDDRGGAAGNFILSGNSVKMNGGAISSNTTLASTQTLDLDINIQGTGNLNFGAQADNHLILSGDISGTGNLVHSSGTLRFGTVTLSGNNSFSGRIDLLGGRLILTNSNATGGDRVVIRDGSSVAPVLELASSGDLTFSNLFNLDRNGDEVAIEVTSGNATLGSVALGGGTGGSNNSVKTLRAASGSTLTVSGAVGEDSDAQAANSSLNIGTGGSSFDGTVVLSGVNTYNGETLINSGTLLVNGSTSTSSAVTVGSGATLGGIGTVGGNTIVNGAHTAGTAGGAGPQTFSNDLTYNSGSTITWDLIDASSTAGAGWDTFTLNATDSDLNFAAAVGEIMFNINDFDLSFDPLTDQDFLVWTGYNSLTGFNENDFVISYTGSAIGVSGSNFKIFDDTAATLGTAGVYVRFTAVPEPSTYALMGLGLGAFGWVIRRRRKVVVPKAS
ncbi:MAG: PEP-CTERM sorting domain-containing protein [Verrucomicrobiota bacterium]